VATRADVRRIALALPETEEADGHFAFSVRNKTKLKGFAWVWMERVVPKKPRVANPAVLAVRVANVGQRDALIAAEPTKFFTEPHYEGFPAVLVRLSEVKVGELRTLLEEAWRCMAPAEREKAKTTRSTRSPRRKARSHTPT
jgi:hypothetical protein